MPKVNRAQLARRVTRVIGVHRAVRARKAPKVTLASLGKRVKLDNRVRLGLKANRVNVGLRAKTRQFQARWVPRVSRVFKAPGAPLAPTQQFQDQLAQRVNPDNRAIGARPALKGNKVE